MGLLKPRDLGAATMRLCLELACCLELGHAVIGKDAAAQASGGIVTAPPPVSAKSATGQPTSSSQRASDRTPQRMLLAPGCYVVRPGQLASVSAYCLDEKAPAAPLHTSLVPISDGAQTAHDNTTDRTITLRVGDGPTLSLEQGIARHLIRLESLGADDYFHVGLRNLTDRSVALCIPAATAVAAEASAPDQDVTALSAEIAKALPPLSQPRLGSHDPARGSSDEQHVVIQQQLWHDFAKYHVDLAADDPLRPAARCKDMPDFIHGAAQAPPKGGVVTALTTLRCRPN